MSCVRQSKWPGSLHDSLHDVQPVVLEFGSYCQVVVGECVRVQRHGIMLSMCSVFMLHTLRVCYGHVTKCVCFNSYT